MAYVSHGDKTNLARLTAPILERPSIQTGSRCILAIGHWIFLMVFSAILMTIPADLWVCERSPDILEIMAPRAISTIRRLCIWLCPRYSGQFDVIESCCMQAATNFPGFLLPSWSRTSLLEVKDADETISERIRNQTRLQ